MEEKEKKLTKMNRRLRRQVRGLKQQLTLQVAQATGDKPSPKTTPLKVKNIGGRKWWQVFLGLALLGGAILTAIIYMSNPNNMMLAVFFVALGGGGVLFLFIGLKKRDEGIKFVRPGSGKAPVKINANALNIYYGKDENGKVFCDRITFEEMAEKDIKSKHPQRCLDDGKWYYVHIYDPNKKELVPFTLPDTQYYDPREMVNPATMPATKKVLKPKPTLGEKLRPVLLVVAIGILGIIFIATGGTPPPGG